MEMYKFDPDRVRKFWTTLQECWLKLYGAPFATVALINVTYIFFILLLH